MYSCSHCLTRIPKAAVARLMTRLHDQRVLIRTDDGAAEKGGMGANGGDVEFTKADEMERLANWREICVRI